jgi:hypothetical protein
VPAIDAILGRGVGVSRIVVGHPEHIDVIHILHGERDFAAPFSLAQKTKARRAATHRASTVKQSQE